MNGQQDELKDRLLQTDLRDFVSRHYGREFTAKGFCLCPIHDERTASFQVSKGNGRWIWHCFGCGKGGDIFALVAAVEGLDHKADFPSIKRKVAEMEGLAAERPERRILRVHEYTDEDGVPLYRKVRFDTPSKANRFEWQHLEGDKWVAGMGNARRVPYRLPGFKDSPTVVLCEGERDADTLAALGIAATSGPMGKGSKGNGWPAELTPHFAAKDVAIIYDVGNNKDAEGVAAKLHGTAKSVVILTVPMPNREDDITDYLGQIDGPDGMHDAWLGILAAGRRYPEPGPEPEAVVEGAENGDAVAVEAESPVDEGKGDKGEAMCGCLSEMESAPVPWLWQNIIPLGRISMISGNPGVQKTFFGLYLATVLSRGWGWPDRSPAPTPANTIYIGVEDDPNDTIRPRVDSLGGDASRIWVYRPDQPNHLDLFKLEGVKRLNDEIVRIGDVKLIIIDPILDFSGRANPNKAEDVRALLTPLSALAKAHNLAIVLLAHLNKAQSMDAIYRTAGSSGGWMGKVRAAFVIVRDKDDSVLRHIAPLKANLAPTDPPQFRFRITNGRIDISVSDVPIDIDEQMAPKAHQRPGPEPEARTEAVRWLTEYLAGQGGNVASRTLESAATAEGISKRTLQRAKDAAGAISKRENGVWVVVLKDKDPKPN